MDEEQLRRLYEELQKAIEEEAEQKRILGKVSKKTQADLDLLRTMILKSGKSLADLAKEIDAVAVVEKKKEEANKQYVQRLKSDSAAFGKSVLGMAGAAGNGNTNFSILSGTVKSVTTALGGLASGIPLIGKFLDKTAQAVGDGATFVIGQLDKVAEAYSELGKVGAIASTGVDGLRKQFDQIGLVGLPEFVEAVKNNSVALRALGPTVAQGGEILAKSFGILTKDGGEYRDTLLSLGYTTKDIARITAEYGANQVLMGNRRIKNEKDLAKASFEYMKEIDALSRATGQSKETILEEQKKNRLDVAFNEYINDLMKTDPEAAKRLDKYVSSLTGAAAEAARGMATGAITTERGARATVLYGDAIRENMALVRQGMDPEKARQRTLEAGVGRLEGQFKDLVKLNVTDAFGGPEAIRQLQEYRAQQQAGSLGIEEAAKEQKNLTESQKGLTSDFVKAQAAVAGFARETQRLGFDFIKPAATAVEKFTTTLNDAVKSIRKGLGMAETPAASGGVGRFGTRSQRAAARRQAAGEEAPGGAAPGGAAPGGAAPGGAARSIDTSGLRLKSAEAVAGGESNAKIVALARQIQDKLGGDLVYFSALNDSYHSGTNSKHAQGMALDFTIRNPKYSAGTADLVRNILAQSGLQGKVLDEYLNPSKSATGGHIHVELMQKGGITSGPSIAGEAGPEAVVPLPDGKSIPVELRNLRIGGLGMDMSYQAGPLSTDTKLTDMIMQRLGLNEFDHKRMINASGIGLNYNIAGAEFGSKIGGGLMQEEITNQVAKLVESGQPLQEALKNTLAEFQQAMQEFLRQNDTDNGNGMITLSDQLRQLVDLQRNQNNISSKILQVSQN